jgi:hypothetical protein
LNTKALLMPLFSRTCLESSVFDAKEKCDMLEKMCLVSLTALCLTSQALLLLQSADSSDSSLICRQTARNSFTPPA